MNGALPPKSVLVAPYSCIVLMFASPLFDRRHRASFRAGKKLPRPADLVFGIGDHFVQLRDPADGSGQRENRGEQRHWNADRLLYDPRIEVDVGIELARDEIIVLERDLLERHRELEQRVVAKTKLA